MHQEGDKGIGFLNVLSQERDFHGAYQDYMRDYIAAFRSVPSSWHRHALLA